MSHPFTIIKGGQAESKKPAEKFAQFDNTRALGDRMMARFYADRDRAIDKIRAKQAKK